MTNTERFTSKINRMIRPAVVAGGVGLVLAIAGFILSGPARFLQSYLFTFMFLLDLTLGSLAVLVLHYLVGGRWGMLIRRNAEAATKNLWLMAVLFIPILIGLHYLYPWTQDAIVSGDPVLEHKQAYLNLPFFILRAVLYFAIWLGTSRALIRWGTNPATFTDPLVRRNFQRLAAFTLILYVISLTFAGVDWVMSLSPKWFSAIYGMLMISAQALAGLALATLFLPWLARHTPLGQIIRPDNFRDLGAFLFSFVIIWAYMAYSQFIIVWSGNLPIEAVWYLARSQGGWLWIGITIFVVQFVLPFATLMSYRAKRNPRVLIIVSAIVLAMRLLDNFWQIMPYFYPSQITVHWLDIVLPLALGGVWLAVFFWNLQRTPLLLPADLGAEPVEHPATAAG